MNTITQLLEKIMPNISAMLSKEIPSLHYYHLTPAHLLVNPLSLHDFLLKPLAIDIEKIYFHILDCVIQKIDNDFFHSMERKSNYRAKGKKPRTLITQYGCFTFVRHSYQNKKGGNHFYFIDKAFQIEKYQRFEKALILEIYRQIGSEIAFSKIGKNIGKLIYRNTSLKENQRIISRQTIHQIFKRLDTTITPVYQPIPIDTLYIEADEHYIALQEFPKKIMVKAAKIYTKDALGNKQKPLFYLDNGKPFWEQCIAFLQSKYDLEAVKRVWILGDGANWIRQGVTFFDRKQATFCLDYFHYTQALYLFLGRQNKALYNLVHSYLLHHQKKDFLSLLTTFHQEENRNTKTFEASYRYLIRNYNSIQKSFRHKQKCAMENTISHVLAAICTSRPKAFKTATLYKRLCLRMHYLNCKDETAFFALFQSKKTTNPTYYQLFSQIDRFHKKDTYTVNLPYY